MNQCYFNGDFYQCVTATTAGQSPATTAAKWRKVKLLGKWRWVLAQLTYAHLLRLDGQTDKANVERSIGYGRDRTGLDELVTQEANEENHQTRCGGRGRAAVVNTGRTRPVAASVILDDAYRLIGWDAEDLDDREKQDARMALSTAVQEVWEAWWWQELMKCEQLFFSPEFSGSENYGVGSPVYWAKTDAYYLGLADDNSAEPTQSGSTDTADTWYLFTSPELPALWSSTGSYGAGDKVSWAGRNYQSAIDSNTEEPGTGDYWVEIPEWTPTFPWTVGSTTQGPFGPIRSVSKFDPRTSANPQPYELDVTEDGTRVMKLSVGRPWVWSRRVTPIITGDEFSTTATYEATDPQDLVYDS